MLQIVLLNGHAYSPHFCMLCMCSFNRMHMINLIVGNSCHIIEVEHAVWYIVAWILLHTHDSKAKK